MVLELRLLWRYLLDWVQDSGRAVVPFLRARGSRTRLNRGELSSAGTTVEPASSRNLSAGDRRGWESLEEAVAGHSAMARVRGPLLAESEHPPYSRHGWRVAHITITARV